jgi:hypothetical protein
VLVRLTALFALLAAATVVAGCGGGSSSTETNSGGAAESTQLTKAAFVEEADALCSEYQAEVAPIKAELEALQKVPNAESPQNEKQLGELLNEAIAEAEADLESIRELEPPQADSATIEKMLDTAQEGNVLDTEAAAALEAGETSRFGELAKEVEATNNRAKGMAEGYGLKVCGQAS